MDSGLHAGLLLDGKYKILRRIGRGGMGSVYEGENVRIGRRVAIKVLHANIALERRFVERFEREAQAVARIGSHHVADVLDLGELAAGDRYMVMEYLQGQTLAERVKEAGPMPAQEVIPLIVQLLDGLATMHAAGIVHRDLKPGNIFLTQTAGAADFVKILDFGIAKFSSANDIQWTTIGSTILGTPGYLAPEQLTHEDVGAEADLYAAGVLLYRCLAGRLPYDATTNAELLLQIRDGVRVPIEEVIPDIDRTLSAIVMKGIDPILDARFASASDFRAALLAWARAAEQRGKFLADFLDVSGRSSSIPKPASRPPRFVSQTNEAELEAAPISATLAYDATIPIERPASGDRLDSDGPTPVVPAPSPVVVPALAPLDLPIDEERAPYGDEYGAHASEPPTIAQAPAPQPPVAKRAPSKLRAIVVGAVVGVACVVVAYEMLRP